jgi:hypothetical protein
MKIEKENIIIFEEYKEYSQLNWIENIEIKQN